ncbi:MAG TPA: hypothetical protein O0X23_05240 [Methanocorpusculum sp.]|nr:hypothetical protein [Methanocorpusculum sp.]
MDTGGGLQAARGSLMPMGMDDAAAFQGVVEPDSCGECGFCPAR